MRVARLQIQNYRSIKALDIELGDFNVFIGPNNAGKTNILQALNLVLGETYPTPRAFTGKDFHLGDPKRPISISVHFNEPIQGDGLEAWGFRLEFDGSGANYVALGKNGEPLSYPSGKPVRVSNDMRDSIPLVYLSVERLAEEQIRPTQWRMYGKIIRHVETQITADDKDQFIDKVGKAFEEHLRPAICSIEQKLGEYTQEHLGLQVSLELRTLDPFNVLRNLRPYLAEAGSDWQFDAEEMGAGTQSALTIALARVYAEVVREALVLVIEEPELHLHPHGCRHLYDVLKDLSSKGVQVILTTHSRDFVNIMDFEALYLVKKEKGETRVMTARGVQISHKDRLAVAAKFNDEMKEIFFASVVVLVEAAPDQIACKCALENFGLNLNARNVSVVNCNGKENVIGTAQILCRLGVTTLALIDEDPDNPYSCQQTQKLRQILGEDNVLLQRPNLEGTWGLQKKPTTKEALEYFPQRCKQDIPQVYKSLYERLNRGV